MGQQFLGHCIEMDVRLSAYCIATAVLVVLSEVSAQERAYTPQYKHHIKTHQNGN
jgi:hypothetical protein